ncbi:unnamed protein product, partial [Mesorhabditis spiculigera]
MNLTDIARMSEREAIEFLVVEGVLQNPHCRDHSHAKMRLIKKQKDRYRWECAPCIYSKRGGGMHAVRDANWLQDSRLPIKSVLLLVYLWSTGLSSVQQLSKEMGDVAATTVIDWCRYLRDVCGWATSERLKESRIGGPGTICELDETVMSRRKYHRGRIVKARWLFGGICRETKEMFAVLVPDRRAETLMSSITAHIAPGTTIITDGFASYKGLADHPDYNWQWVNHKENFVKPGHPQVHTQTVERMWRPLKDAVRSRHGTDEGQVESYVAEGIWRQLHGNDDAFKAILADIAFFWPPGTDIDSVPFYAEE